MSGATGLRRRVDRALGRPLRRRGSTIAGGPGDRADERAIGDQGSIGGAADGSARERSGHGRRSSRRSASRRTGVRGLVGRILLDVLALAGLACILLVAASFLFGISIIMFATGSMSPTIPAGSAALVREIPATEMAVGDVVTVDRGEQQLPVTHRVIAIDDVDGERVTFRMQGDDNDEPDLEPYEQTSVRLVLWSVPGLATAISQLQSPWVLGSVTLGATTLVTWAFWPRDGRRR